MKTTRKDIDKFLKLRRFAAIGVSRNPKDFTRQLFAEFVKQGYDIVPVNPAVTEIEGRQCFGSVLDIQPSVTGALLLTAPAVTDRVVRECIAAGVSHLWMYRAGGEGAVSPQAVALCLESGINLVAGECPFMFLPNTGFPHRVHGFVRKVLGTYPK